MVMELFEDSTFWLLISFLVFCFILIKHGRGAFLSLIDSRIDGIKQELETAENLRVEAQEMLAQYQRKHRDATQEAETIILKATQRAHDIKAESIKELDELTSRREQQLAERIKRMEEAAVADIKAHTADLAIKVTKQIIADQSNKTSNDALIDKSIKSLSKNLK